MSNLFKLSTDTLQETYQVRDVKVTVRHFERVAEKMNLEISAAHNLPVRTDYPLPLHGKMPALNVLLKSLQSQGITRVGCFASHGSNWAQGLPALAALYGFEKTIVVYATNPRAPNYPDWLKQARSLGATLVPVKPNMTAINSSQAKKLIEEEGAYFIPFGLDTEPVLTYLTNAMNFPDQLDNLVLCCGSGITLVGIVQHLIQFNKHIKRIIGVSSGRPVTALQKTLTDHVGAVDSAHVAHIDLREGYQYSQKLKTISAWPTHPYYELKAYDWLEKNIHTLDGAVWFLNMGLA